MIFHDSTKMKIFQNIKMNEKFKNLDDSEVLNSDFPGQKTSAGSMTSTASTTSVASMTFTASFHQKNTDPDSLIIPGTHMTNTSFSGMDHQKSKFSLISEPSLSEAVEASQCYIFENWLIKLKFPNLLTPLCTNIF